jgi:hypothetical protein
MDARFLTPDPCAESACMVEIRSLREQRLLDIMGALKNGLHLGRAHSSPSQTLEMPQEIILPNMVLLLQDHIAIIEPFVFAASGSIYSHVCCLQGKHA